MAFYKQISWKTAVWLIVAVFGLLFIGAGTAIADLNVPMDGSAITIDGTINETEYVTIATKLNENDGFGPNIDVTSINLYRDETNEVLYIGVTGKLDTENNNGIGLWLNIDSPNSVGVPAGTALGGSGGHYMNGDNGDELGFKADFEVDYMFALNPGSGSNSVFVDVAKLVGQRTTQYLGTSDQAGTAELNENSGVFDEGSVTFAFNNSGETNTGWEIAIPYAQIGLVPGQSNIYAFAFVVSPTAFFSNVTVPGNILSAPLPPEYVRQSNIEDNNIENLGFIPDFSSILLGGPFNGGMTPTAVSLANIGVNTAVPTGLLLILLIVVGTAVGLLTSRRRQIT